ncbi:hypothetical protein ACGFZK_09415 [Streptomyces sp. NPDC048257]|uniref:hypothetical protein n=1 Tax=Streptomyces sp. NPDC048257 TaxID=3365526 RepID=UPI00371F920B
MTESEKSTNSRTTSRSSANGTKTRTQAASAARDGAKAASDTAGGALGSLTALPAPLAEKTAAAAKAVRGTVGRAGWIWTAVRARKAIAAGAATGTAVVVTTAYTLGRRAGLRRRGPLSRLTGGRI